MTVYDYWMRSIPDYYKNMALDGYSPYEILAALRQQMIQEHEERTEAPIIHFDEENDR